MKKIKKVTEIEQLDNLLALYIAEENVKRAKTECAYREKVLELLKGAQMKREKLAEEMQEDDPAPAQWLDGSQESCVRLAQRILNKLPSIPYNCSIDISFLHYNEDGISLQVKAYNPNRKGNCFESLWMYEHDEPEKQAADISDWLERAGKLLACKPSNDHVAEPIGSALDAMFGGNPLDDFPTLERKEAENE